MGKSEALLTTSGNAMYDAVVGFMVSERTDVDSWNLVATDVAARVKAGESMDTIRLAMRMTEQQVKQDYSITSLPTAWRTAKHTALAAVANNVALLDSDDKPVPKTELDRRIKGGVPRNKPVKPPYHQAWWGLDAAESAVAAGGMTCVERGIVLTKSERLVQSIKDMACA